MTDENQASVQKIAILGCGAMGTALLKGWLQDSNASKNTYAAHVRTTASEDRLQREIGINAKHVQIASGNESLVEAVHGSALVLIGVHLGDLDVLLHIPGLIAELKGKVLVSMLAGVSTKQIQTALNAVASKNGIQNQVWPVARIIPTLGAIIGESVTLLASDPATEKPEYIKDFERLFSPLGPIQYIPEKLMNEATAIGAAVHALAITAVESATDASVADGVPRNIALALAANSLRSCSGLMLAGGMSPEQVKAAMSTPAGITLNSIIKLDESTRSGIAGTVRNAISYTRQMSG